MQIQLFHLNEKFHHLYFFIVCHERLLKIPLIVFERLFPSAQRSQYQLIQQAREETKKKTFRKATTVIRTHGSHMSHMHREISVTSEIPISLQLSHIDSVKFHVRAMLFTFAVVGRRYSNVLCELKQTLIVQLSNGEYHSYYTKVATVNISKSVCFREYRLKVTNMLSFYLKQHVKNAVLHHNCSLLEEIGH